jgi:hypothetical protein
MTRDEYEEHRQALEEQLRADIALVHAAHEVRVRSLERLRLAGKEGGQESAPASSNAMRKPSRPRGSVLDDLEAALPRLPAVFDKRDVVGALGYKPSRATLFRALQQLQEDREIAIQDYSAGGSLTRYRKLKP